MTRLGSGRQYRHTHDTPVVGRLVPARSMKVELQYFDDCPNWRVADERLTHALRATGNDAVEIRYVEVTSPSQAEELGFAGSPTILIDGMDPFADHSPSVGYACRLFATPDGLAGSPTTEQVIAALAPPEHRPPEPEWKSSPEFRDALPGT